MACWGRLNRRDRVVTSHPCISWRKPSFSWHLFLSRRCPSSACARNLRKSKANLGSEAACREKGASAKAQNPRLRRFHILLALLVQEGPSTNIGGFWFPRPHLQQILEPETRDRYKSQGLYHGNTFHPCVDIVALTKRTITLCEYFFMLR